MHSWRDRLLENQTDGIFCHIHSSSYKIYLLLNCNSSNGVAQWLCQYLSLWEPWQCYVSKPTHCDHDLGRCRPRCRCCCCCCCCCWSPALAAKVWNSCSEHFCSTNLWSGTGPGSARSLHLKSRKHRFSENPAGKGNGNGTNRRI